MKLRHALMLGLGGAAIAALLIEPSLAQTPTPEAASPPPSPIPNKGDTAWMMISSALVLMMSIPGLALFYGGLVRTKNMLSVLTQVFAIVSIVGLLWVFYGYSLAFTNGGGLNDFVGGLSKAFLKGIDANSTVATFSNGVVIPEYAYLCFQMTFAMITPALMWTTVPPAKSRAPFWKRKPASLLTASRAAWAVAFEASSVAAASALAALPTASGPAQYQTMWAMGK